VTPNNLTASYRDGNLIHEFDMDSSSGKIILSDDEMHHQHHAHASLLTLGTASAVRPKTILLNGKHLNDMKMEKGLVAGQKFSPMQSKVFLCLVSTLILTSLLNLVLEFWAFKALRLANVSSQRSAVCDSICRCHVKPIVM
jgi:hypothetical protein